MQISNKPITQHQLDAFNPLKLKLSIRIRKKGDISDFECGMVVATGETGLIISETPDLLGFFPHNHLKGLQKIEDIRSVAGHWKCLFVTRGQRRKARLL